MAKPKYLQIYEQINRNIETGFYQPGAKLPSEKELSQNYGVSRITSKKALEMLAEQGSIVRQPGRGSFVRLPGDVSRRPAEPEGAAPRRIGLICENIGRAFGLVIFQAVERAAAEHHFLIVPRFTYGFPEAEEQAISELLETGVDGVIITASHGQDINRGLLRLVTDRVPLVLADRFLRGIPAPFVGTDNSGSTQRATDYLLGLGHRSISFLTRPYVNTFSIEDRVSGFVRSHAEHGVAIDESKWITDIESVQAGHNTGEFIERDLEKIRRLVDANRDVTCLFAAEYEIAVMARRAVEQLGLRVPEDISILCFDGEVDWLGNTFFTRIVQREEKIGRKLVELLLEQLKDGESPQNRRYFYDADLVIGRSTCPPGSR